MTPPSVFGAALVVALALTALPSRAAAELAPVPKAGVAGLVLSGMTFVQSDGSVADMIVEADRGRLDSDTNVVHLDVVRTRVTGNAERSGFDMTCDRGELSLDSHALYASGNVRGRTEDGREFATTWVRYDPQKEIAYTDAPVEIDDATGSLQGGGFRYHVREGRFRLLGGATVRREN